MGETCCLCFPLDCGIKTLAIFTILNAIGTGVYCYFDIAYWNLYWVLVGC